MIIYRGGSNLVHDIYVKDKYGAAIDITGDTITFYVKNSLSDADADAVVSVAAAVIDGAAGFCQATISQAAIADLESRYFPYIVKRASGGITSFVEYGIFNVNEVWNEWEWDIDIFEGISLSSLISQANTLLRYRDWDTNELIEWCNDAVKDWCKRTGYLISRATRESVQGQNIYTLPKGLITIRNVYLDGTEIYRNRGWIRENNSIIFSDNNMTGGKEIEIICNKYAQEMTNNYQYAEVVEEATEAIIYYICWKAKLEDREFSEADYYWRLYEDYANDYTTKNTIDNTLETQLHYVGQGTTNGIGRITDAGI